MSWGREIVQVGWNVRGNMYEGQNVLHFRDHFFALLYTIFVSIQVFVRIDCIRFLHLLDFKGKGKGKGLDTCYSATYMSQTRDQQRFYNL